MSAVKVERRHRYAAWIVIGRCKRVSRETQHWLDTGEFSTHSTEMVFTLAMTASTMAQFETHADARGYQRCQNDVVAWLRRLDPNWDVPRLIESGSHIGASDSVPMGREGE